VNAAHADVGANFRHGLATHMRDDLEDKLDEALKQTFPASDAFWLPPVTAWPRPAADERTAAEHCSAPD
jgi:hypothetical protein